MKRSSKSESKLSRLGLKLTVFVLIFGLSSAVVLAEQVPLKKANYKLAARFTSAKMNKLMYSTSVRPVWLEHSDRFWYSYETSEGKVFYLVDPVRKSKRALFDNVKMAAMLTRLTKDPYDAKHLPISTIKFTNNDRAIRFNVQSSKEMVPAEEDEEEGEEKEEEEKKEVEKTAEAKKPKMKKKTFYFEYNLASGKLSELKDYKEKPKRPSWASISPDKKWVVFGKDYNLYMMDWDNYQKVLKKPKTKDVEEIQLTTDGEEHYGFGYSGRGRNDEEKKKNKGKRVSAGVMWSKDSKKIAVSRSDSRKVKELWVIHSVGSKRPMLETYKYAMPGDKALPQAELFVIDLGTKKRVNIKAEKFKDQTLSVSRAPFSNRSREEETQRSLWLSDTSDKLYFSRTSRDLHRVDTCVADTESGEVTVLIEERLNTYIETRGLYLVNDGKELIHWSERDGWAHFYLFDGQGKLKRQLTSGPWHCSSIAGLNEKTRTLYFSANGREKGEDPYYQHLYRVSLDGGSLQMLNAGDFNHSAQMIDNQRFFVDNYSRVDTAPQSVVRDGAGRLLMNLETADLSRLMEAGYKFPETFKVKADDGVTDIYGVMYKPFDFDENKMYPIIAYVYPGPQTESVPKSFSSSAQNVSLAQFGFVVICVGNRGGHPDRSKWYHNYGYGNLRDYGLADKKAAIEQLAARHPFVDIDRVGIFGHSGGGFMSTAAMLVYPDFFKVAVSSAGNHENNVYNKWWSEKHHGVKEVENEKGEITFEYRIDKNSELAKNLKGRLLIVHGDVDNNVHPANTLRLAEALIKANKRFDMFIFPGQRHGFGPMSNYFSWMRADYFCKHLIGDYSVNVDMIELSREIEQNGKKRSGGNATRRR